MRSTIAALAAVAAVMAGCGPSEDPDIAEAADGACEVIEHGMTADDIDRMARTLATVSPHWTADEAAELDDEQLSEFAAAVHDRCGD